MGFRVGLWTKVGFLLLRPQCELSYMFFCEES